MNLNMHGKKLALIVYSPYIYVSIKHILERKCLGIRRKHSTFWCSLLKKGDCLTRGGEKMDKALKRCSLPNSEWILLCAKMWW